MKTWCGSKRGKMFSREVETRVNASVDVEGSESALEVG